MDMDVGGPAQQAPKKPPVKTLSDFSAMGNLLSKIENKIEKQATHQQRMVNSKAMKVSEMDRDKERLEKIGSLQAF